MDSLSPESAGAEEARIRTVYAERQRNDVRLGFAALAGRRGPSSKCGKQQGSRMSGLRVSTDMGSNPNQALCTLV
jgi:hypothetical protein